MPRRKQRTRHNARRARLRRRLDLLVLEQEAQKLEGENSIIRRVLLYVEDIYEDARNRQSQAAAVQNPSDQHVLADQGVSLALLSQAASAASETFRTTATTPSLQLGQSASTQPPQMSMIDTPQSIGPRRMAGIPPVAVSGISSSGSDRAGPTTTEMSTLPLDYSQQQQLQQPQESMQSQFTAESSSSRTESVVDGLDERSKQLAEGLNAVRAIELQLQQAKILANTLRQAVPLPSSNSFDRAGTAIEPSSAQSHQLQLRHGGMDAFEAHAKGIGEKQALVAPGPPRGGGLRNPFGPTGSESDGSFGGLVAAVAGGMPPGPGGYPADSGADSFAQLRGGAGSSTISSLAGARGRVKRRSYSKAGSFDDDGADSSRAGSAGAMPGAFFAKASGIVNSSASQSGLEQGSSKNMQAAANHSQQQQQQQQQQRASGPHAPLQNSGRPSSVSMRLAGLSRLQPPVAPFGHTGTTSMPGEWKGVGEHRQGSGRRAAVRQGGHGHGQHGSSMQSSTRTGTTAPGAANGHDRDRDTGSSSNDLGLDPSRSVGKDSRSSGQRGSSSSSAANSNRDGNASGGGRSGPDERQSGSSGNSSARLVRGGRAGERHQRKDSSGADSGGDLDPVSQAGGAAFLVPSSHMRAPHRSDSGSDSGSGQSGVGVGRLGVPSGTASHGASSHMQAVLGYRGTQPDDDNEYGQPEGQAEGPGRFQPGATATATGSDVGGPGGSGMDAPGEAAANQVVEAGQATGTDGAEASREDVIRVAQEAAHAVLGGQVPTEVRLSDADSAMAIPPNCNVENEIARNTMLDSRESFMICNGLENQVIEQGVAVCTVMFVSDGLQKMCGFMPGELVGLPWTVLLHPEHRSEDAASMQLTTMRRAGMAEAVVQCRKRDGSCFWNHCLVAPVIHNSPGSPVIRWAFLMKEVTPEFARERKLQLAQVEVASARQIRQVQPGWGKGSRAGASASGAHNRRGRARASQQYAGQRGSRPSSMAGMHSGSGSGSGRGTPAQYQEGFGGRPFHGSGMPPVSALGMSMARTGGSSGHSSVHMRQVRTSGSSGANAAFGGLRDPETGMAPLSNGNSSSSSGGSGGHFGLSGLGPVEWLPPRTGDGKPRGIIGREHDSRDAYSVASSMFSREAAAFGGRSRSLRAAGMDGLALPPRGGEGGTGSSVDLGSAEVQSYQGSLQPGNASASTTPRAGIMHAGSDAARGAQLLPSGFERGSIGADGSSELGVKHGLDSLQGGPAPSRARGKAGRGAPVGANQNGATQMMSGEELDHQRSGSAESFPRIGSLARQKHNGPAAAGSQISMPSTSRPFDLAAVALHTHQHSASSKGDSQRVPVQQALGAGHSADAQEKAAMAGDDQEPSAKRRRVQN